MNVDIDFVSGALLLSALNLVATVAIALGVVRVVRRRRLLETLWRLRLARWRHQMDTGE